MNYTEIKLRLEGSTALKLLRAEQAPLCLGFLRSVFRVDRAITRSQPEMIARLTTTIEEINDLVSTREAPTFTGGAKYYIDKWVADGAIITRYGDNDDILYELSPEADQAILFLERLGEKRQNTRGAHSKLRVFIDRLNWIAERANPDRQKMIDALDAQISDLQDQRFKLAAGETIVSESPERLIEEYQFARDTAQELLADFSRIRQLFLGVAQDMAERYASADASRGDLLEKAIVAHDQLKKGPLGMSFSAFRQYIGDNSTQNVLFDLIKATQEIPQLTESIRDDYFLQRLPESLLKEAIAVIEQTRRLSSDLRRMLDSRAITARRETQEALKTVMSLAYSVAETPPDGEILESWSASGASSSAEVHTRGLWRAPDVIPPVEESKPAPNAGKAAMLSVFSNLAAVEMKRLRSQLNERLSEENHGFRLTEMLDWYPPKEGHWLLDVLGYLEIAHGKRSHHSLKQDETWSYRPPGSNRSYRIPQIYFFK